MIRTFQHRFKGGTVATMVVDDNYAPGASHVLSIQWSRQPKPRVLPEYVRWCHCVNELMAAETGKKIMHIFRLPGNEIQSWVYEPGQPGQRVFA